MQIILLKYIYIYINLHVILLKQLFSLLQWNTSSAYKVRKLIKEGTALAF